VLQLERVGGGQACHAEPMTNELSSAPRSVLVEVPAGLDEVLGSVHRDELICAPQLRHRIEGARVALLQLVEQRHENDR
jgi:hypothetical protein